MKTRKKYRSLLLAALLCLSLAACGDPDGDIAGGDWRTTGAVDAYGTVARDGEEIDVCACLYALRIALYRHQRRLQQRPAAHALSRGHERILHRVGVGKGRRLSLSAV